MCPAAKVATAAGAALPRTVATWSESRARAAVSAFANGFHPNRRGKRRGSAPQTSTSPNYGRAGQKGSAVCDFLRGTGGCPLPHRLRRPQRLVATASRDQKSMGPGAESLGNPAIVATATRTSAVGRTRRSHSRHLLPAFREDRAFLHGRDRMRPDDKKKPARHDRVVGRIDGQQPR